MKKLLLSILLICPLNLALAGETDTDTVRKALKAFNVKPEPDSIKKSKVPGFYQVSFGAQVFYVSADGEFLIDGDIWAINRRVNLTEQQRSTGRVKAVSSIDEWSLLKFAPSKEKAKYTVTAFTDIDCGYCRKLHQEIKDYNKLGIEIRYAAYPRSGLQTPSYFKAVAVWCAKDRNKAMTFAKGGAKLEQLQKLEQVKGDDCKKAIQEHMKVAREVGVSGTPTLVMEDGSVLPGYVPADRLLQELKNARRL